MKKTVLSLGLFFLALTAFSQTINLNKPLPTDKSIRKGILPNGLTYYIKSTDVVKDAASYYIIQNVGSILENEGQQGLAHFLEHMAFNGTKNFPGKEMLNALQKYGAVFGKDINAYTSFDETVYNLNNIPTKDGLVDTCLTVLHDWCNYLLLTDEEIDAERGVIKEEKRTRENGRMRLFKTSLPILFNHSKYAKRIPIGLMSVVENFEYKALRDFYHDWYRTDLQAIVVIGDVEIDKIESQIKSKFSHIPAVKNPRERFIVTVPNNKNLLYVLATDPEITTPSISFGIRHKKTLKEQTVTDLKQSLLEGMVTSMLSTRISDKAQKPKVSFLNAGGGLQSMTRTSKVFSYAITPKPNKQQEAFTEVLTEIVRAVKYGFVKPEIDRTIKRFSNYYETQISKKEDLPHGVIVKSIQKNYLSNETITDIAKEYELVKEIFATLKPEELHNTIKRLYTKNNRYVNVTGVKGKNNLTEDQAKAIINSVENDATLTPYKEKSSGKTLVSDIDIKKGSIKEIKENKEIDAITYVLNNGIKVHYKFADKEKNKVDFKAISYGGKSLLSEDQLASSELLGNLIKMSGLGNYRATELPKILAGKSASASISLGNTSESVNGSSTTKDVETMLQMVYLHFEKPRFDKDAYTRLQENISQYLVRKSKDIKSKMKDGITTTLYGEKHPRKRIFNQELLNEASFDKIKAIYHDRFENPADFEFYIVGDITQEQLEPLLIKYIASLPTNNTKENFKDNNVNWVSKKIDEDIYLEMETPKANVNIAFKKEVDYTIKNKLVAKALGAILQLRINETVREQEGGAYSPRVSARVTRHPRSSAILFVAFDCNPDTLEKLVRVVHQEINKVATGEIIEEEVNKTLTNFLKERTQAKNRNGYDMSLLTTYFREGYNMNKASNFENIVNKISKKDIQKFAKNLKDKGQHFEIVFKPKK